MPYYGYDQGFTPTAPDLNNYYNNLDKANLLAQQQQQRDLQQQTGQQLAAGNIQGAAGTAAAGGDLNTWSAIQKVLQQKQQDELDALNRQYQAIGNYALSFDPSSATFAQDWHDGIVQARAAGMNIPQGWENDPSTQKIALGLANLGTQAVNATLARRKLADAEDKTAVGKTLPQIDGGLTGDDAMNAIKAADPGTAATVQALISGKMAFPGSFAMAKPYWQGMLGLVAQVDPNFDTTNYNARNDTAKDFSTKGKSGQNISAFNTSLAHLQRLNNSIDPLGNFGNLPVGNVAANWATSGSLINTPGYEKAVSQFRTDRQAAADELTRAFRLAGGNVHDIEGWEKTLSETQTPEALHTAVREGINLLEGRMQAQADNYNRVMGTNKSVKDLLSPSAQAAWTEIMGGPKVVTPDILKQANEAIQNGAPRDLVLQRLQRNGYSIEGVR